MRPFQPGSDLQANSVNSQQLDLSVFVTRRSVSESHQAHQCLSLNFELTLLTRRHGRSGRIEVYTRLPTQLHHAQHQRKHRGICVDGDHDFWSSMATSFQQRKFTLAALCPIGCVISSSANSSTRGNSSTSGGWRPRRRKISTSAVCRMRTTTRTIPHQKAMRPALQSQHEECQDPQVTADSDGIAHGTGI